ncbi:hypothetical protein ACG04R_18805 [Roseateles sp. BYS78W]|uniref:Secreted protein n=1 Tax=Pelomonas candidula TaxID=3299025 RepID=A0ABW7HFQ4_9BURK
MPTRRLLPLLALAGVAVAAWMAWPDETLPAAPSPGTVASLPLTAPAAASMAAPAAALPTADCAPTPTLSPHDRAMTLQRAVAQLASDSAGDAVLALLMQRPAGDDPAALAQWRTLVRQAALRSQDAQALRWAATACDSADCRRALLQERVRVEPDNALHWAELIDEDPAAADEAWQGLAASRYWHEQPQAAAERVARALPPGQREALPDLAWAALPAPSAGLTNACGNYGPAHPVGAACAHVATLLLSHSDSPGAWQQGAELARQMGRSDIPPAPPDLPPPPLPAGCAAKQSTR